MAKGRRQSVVCGSRPPSRMTDVPSRTRQLVSSKRTVYPASQNLAVDSNDAWARPGTMWACVASGRMSGKSRLQVCVDCNVAPSGSMMVMGLWSTCLLRTGAPSVMKWLVAPESLRAVGVIGGALVGGAGVQLSVSSLSSHAKAAK